MERKITLAAAILGITAIVLGAFGAHALKKQLTIEELSTFETGVKYQLYHALFLLFLGLTPLLSERAKKSIFLVVIFGVIFFSGSIYLLATKTITGIDFKPLGILTPIGGTLLILGWTILFWTILKRKR